MKSIAMALFLLLTFHPAKAQNYSFTARAHYDEVLAEVKSNHGDNVRLILVEALYIVGPLQIVLDPATGKSEAWIYAFYSPDDQQFVSGFAIDHPQKGTAIGEIGAQAWDPTIDSTGLLPAWIDSDVAATAWGQHGVTAFLNSHPSAYAIGFILINAPPSGPAWGAVLTDDIDTLACSLHAITAEIIECGLTNAIADLSMPKDFQLSELYPNPVNSGSTVSLDITGLKETRITISIYDIRGRLLGSVFDNTIPPGNTRVSIRPGLILQKGMYILKAQSPEGIITRKFVTVW